MMDAARSQAPLGNGRYQSKLCLDTSRNEREYRPRTRFTRQSLASKGLKSSGNRNIWNQNRGETEAQCVSQQLSAVSFL